MNALGPRQVIQYAQKLGISSTIPPYLSSALGAGEATLLEITNAFSLFPNQGVRMTPLRDHPRHRSRGERARGEPPGADRGASAPTPRS